MRPITQDEFNRIRQQTESRLAGASQISFKVKAKMAGDEEITEWLEPGFMCDVRLQSESFRTKHEVQQFPGFENLPYYTDNQTALCILPVRYLLENRFVCTQGDTVTGESASLVSRWKGQPFDIKDRANLAAYNSATVIPPFSDTIVVDNLWGYTPIDNVEFLIQGTQATVDTYTLVMSSEELIEHDYNLRTITGGHQSTIWSQQSGYFNGYRFVRQYFNVTTTDGFKSSTWKAGKRVTR